MKTASKVPHRLWVIIIVFAFCAGAPIIRAQLPTATILGVVKDGTGAIVPEAVLTVRNSGTGQVRTTTSGVDGSYRLSALPVGNYEIRVEHPGFKSELRSGLTLTISQEAAVNFTLELGAVEQTVAVTAEAPLVNTTSGSLGALVDEQKVADLPLNGRNFIDLTLLQPGIQQQKNMNFASGKSGTWFSSNGAPFRSNNFLLDGAIMQNLQGGTSASITGATLGVEGIREYRVVTNSFSAEYGMTMGSQMVIVSKGGTNQFHGSAFEYLRNSAMDARNFFDLKTPTTPRRLPAFERNNFGGSFGGPVRKDKTFFFATFEAVRQRLGATSVTTVIPPADKIDGALVPQISPTIKPLLALFPDPNLPNNQYTFPFSQPTTENYGQIRVDQTFSNNDTFFTRYTVSDGSQTTPLSYPQFKTTGLSRNQYGTLSENHVFSPTLLDTARFSYSRTNIKLYSPSGISGPQFSFIPGQEIGNISIAGLTNLGAQQNFGPDGTTPNLKTQNIFTWSDDLFYTRGRHSFKFGALINHYQQYFLNSNGSRGSLSYASLTTFLQAQPTSISALTPGSISDRTYHYNTLGFYVQDDLRVNSNLTLNLGLRYEFMTQMAETKGHSSSLRDLIHDATFTLGPLFNNPSLRNFSPRFGFAWDVTGGGKTAVRGGFGLLYDIAAAFTPALISAVFGAPPFASTSTIANPPPTTLPLVIPAGVVGKSITAIDYHLRQPHMLQYNLTVEQQLPFGMGLTVAYAGSRGLNLVQRKEGNPTVPQVLPDGRQFWTGNDPRLNRNWDTNNLIAAAGNSWYNSLQLLLIKRLSRGLEFQSSYTWSKLLDETQGTAAGDGTTNNIVGVDPSHPSVDKSPADFDIGQTWRFNAIYHLRDHGSGGISAKLLNGWWVSGILSLQSGYPFTLTLGSNRSRSKVIGGVGGLDHPDLVVGRSNNNITSGSTAGCQGVAPGRPLGTPNFYFDPCAFSIPATGFLGTAGRNILRGPGLANLDLSLVKDTSVKSLGENTKLQFRAEIFNILNHANFAMPSPTVFSAVQNAEAPLANAGRITATATTARQIQLALKLIW